jgi:hypothetical protein
MSTSGSTGVRPPPKDSTEPASARTSCRSRVGSTRSSLVSARSAASPGPGDPATRTGEQRDRSGDRLLVVEKQRRQVLSRAELVAATDTLAGMHRIAERAQPLDKVTSGEPSAPSPARRPHRRRVLLVAGAGRLERAAGRQLGGARAGRCRGLHDGLRLPRAGPRGLTPGSRSAHAAHPGACVGR